jgi:hypothetical protein
MSSDSDIDTNAIKIYEIMDQARFFDQLFEMTYRKINIYCVTRCNKIYIPDVIHYHDEFDIIPVTCKDFKDGKLITKYDQNMSKVYKNTIYHFSIRINNMMEILNK